MTFRGKKTENREKPTEYREEIWKLKPLSYIAFIMVDLLIPKLG